MIPLKKKKKFPPYLVVKTKFYTSGKSCSFLVLHKISTSAEWKRKPGMIHSASYIYTVLLVSNIKEKTQHKTCRDTTNAKVIEH